MNTLNQLSWGPLAIIALSCIALVIYHHFLYPLLLRILANQDKSSAQAEVNTQPIDWPAISILMPAYNEAKYIVNKIYNLGALDYPSEQLTLYIAFDGCTDNTVQLAQAALAAPENQHLQCHLLINTSNQGKVALINQLMAKVNTPWVALTDVSALISVDALKLAARHIRARSLGKPLGVICSHYQMLQPGSAGEATYWRYQSQIKRQEANLGATLGAHGALYLFKQALFSTLPADTINDDFILPMQIVALGYRCVYEPEMNAIELEQASLNTDQQRRRRIAAGNVQQVVRLRHLLMGKAGLGVAFTFLSGKALRVAMPFIMLVAFILSAWLSVNSWLFAGLLFAQLALYLTAAIAPLWEPSCPKLVKALHYLVQGHLANLIGATRYLCGKERHRWHKIDATLSNQKSI